jgi:hypothetical protein
VQTQPLAHVSVIIITFSALAQPLILYLSDLQHPNVDCVALSASLHFH